MSLNTRALYSQHLAPISSRKCSKPQPDSARAVLLIPWSTCSNRGDFARRAMLASARMRHRRHALGQPLHLGAHCGGGGSSPGAGTGGPVEPRGMGDAGGQTCAHGDSNLKPFEKYRVAYCSKHAWSMALCCLSLSRAVVVICRTRSREIFKSRPICSNVSTGRSPRPKRREITVASRGVKHAKASCV